MPAFTCKDGEKPLKIPIITGVPAELKTRYLTNIDLEQYL
jgi:hypothetical protein